MTGRYLDGFDPENFDPGEYLRGRIPEYDSMDAASQSAARILATKDDPLLFAILYFRKTLMEGGDGTMTFGDLHADLCRIARHFRAPLDAINPIRMAFIAPRRAGKTTWLYRIISTWVAAHRHRKFFYVVTATGSQAQLWITNFRTAIEQNKLIRNDYPTLCTPMKRQSTNRAFADTANLYVAESGFVIGSQSADSNRLGLSYDDARPDCILLDDIESPNDSLFELNKRLTNVIDGALPMGQEGATVIFVGTSYKAGSIMDQFRAHSELPDPSSWIAGLGIKVKWYKPFVDKETGEQSINSSPNCRSFWPGRHKTEKLLREEGTRGFAAAYANEPLPETGLYWRDGDITFGRIADDLPCLTVLSLDPAMKTKKKSDFSALSILTFCPSTRQFEVKYGRAVKLNPGLELPQYVTGLLTAWPQVVALIVEDNQGGDLWQGQFGAIPGVRLWQVTNTVVSKEQRAAAVLRMYQSGQVFHSDRAGSDTKQLEKEMYGFPNNLHDDLPDSVNTAVLAILKKYPASPRSRTVQQSSYV